MTPSPSGVGGAWQSPGAALRRPLRRPLRPSPNAPARCLRWGTLPRSPHCRKAWIRRRPALWGRCCIFLGTLRGSDGTSNFPGGAAQTSDRCVRVCTESVRLCAALATFVGWQEVAELLRDRHPRIATFLEVGHGSWWPNWLDFRLWLISARPRAPVPVRCFATGPFFAWKKHS